MLRTLCLHFKASLPSLSFFFFLSRPLSYPLTSVCFIYAAQSSPVQSSSVQFPYSWELIMVNTPRCAPLASLSFLIDISSLFTGSRWIPNWGTTCLCYLILFIIFLPFNPPILVQRQGTCLPLLVLLLFRRCTMLYDIHLTFLVYSPHSLVLLRTNVEPKRKNKTDNG